MKIFHHLVFAFCAGLLTSCAVSSTIVGPDAHAQCVRYSGTMVDGVCYLDEMDACEAAKFFERCFIEDILPGPIVCEHSLLKDILI